jgi:integrase
LENGPGGKRTLYSLRHTYITMKLREGVPAAVIAMQCGTSAAMIELLVATGGRFVFDCCAAVTGRSS